MIKTQSFTNLSKLVPIVSYKVNIHLLSNLKLTVFFFLKRHAMILFDLQFIALTFAIKSVEHCLYVGIQSITEGSPGTECKQNHCLINYAQKQQRTNGV